MRLRRAFESVSGRGGVGAVGVGVALLLTSDSRLGCVASGRARWRACVACLRAVAAVCLFLGGCCGLVRCAGKGATGAPTAEEALHSIGFGAGERKRSRAQVPRRQVPCVGWL